MRNRIAKGKKHSAEGRRFAEDLYAELKKIPGKKVDDNTCKKAMQNFHDDADAIEKELECCVCSLIPIKCPLFPRRADPANHVVA